jgi:hypothetical protein
MPSSPPPDKSKEDRVKETITILNKLKEVGIAETDPAYQEVKTHMSVWVSNGESAVYKIDFHRHGRRGELVLPKRADRAAGLSLKMNAH